MKERLAKPAENLAFCYADTTIPRKLAAGFLQMQQMAKPPDYCRLYLGRTGLAAANPEA